MNESTWNIEQQFQSLFEFSPASVVLINKEGRIIQSNAAFQVRVEKHFSESGVYVYISIANATHFGV